MGDVQGLPLRLSRVRQLFPDWLERWEKRALWSSGLYISTPVLCLSSALYGNSTFPNSGTENLLSTVSAWSDLILSRYDSRVELSKRGKFANRVSLLSARTESWIYTGIRRGWDVNPTYTFNVSEIFYVLLMVQNSPRVLAKEGLWCRALGSGCRVLGSAMTPGHVRWHAFWWNVHI